MGQAKVAPLVGTAGVVPCPATRTSFIPHFGQICGPVPTTSGCIGQAYMALLFAAIGIGASPTAGTSAIPHFGHFPWLVDTTSGCIGQEKDVVETAGPP